MNDLLAARLANQALMASTLTTPLEVVQWMGAIQAQDYYGAKWSLGMRAPGSSDAQVDQALVDKQIVRTWLMRGTLHYAAAVDLGWMLRLLGDGSIARTARRYRELELDENTLACSRDVITAALLGRQQLNRTQLKAILEAAGISTAGQRLIHMLGYASLRGDICHTLTGVNNPVFFLTSEWLPRVDELSRDEALARLARAYFAARSPATLPDFTWWSGLSAADVKKALALAGPKLEQREIDGQPYYLWQVQRPQHSHEIDALLLPGFDEYPLSYKDRRAIIPAELARRHGSYLNNTNGMLPAMLVIDGRLAGLWKRTVKKQAVLVELILFRDLDEREQAAVSLASANYGRFLGLPVILSQVAAQK